MGGEGGSAAARPRGGRHWARHCRLCCPAPSSPTVLLDVNFFCACYSRWCTCFDLCKWCLVCGHISFSNFLFASVGIFIFAFQISSSLTARAAAWVWFSLAVDLTQPPAKMNYPKILIFASLCFVAAPNSASENLKRPPRKMVFLVVNLYKLD